MALNNHKISENDRLYIFNCGHVEWNNKPTRSRGHICHKCGSGLRNIIRKCVDCNKWNLLDGKTVKRMRCLPCAREKQLERERAHSRKKVLKLKTIKGVCTFNEFSSDCVPLELIGQIIPRQEELQRINDSLDQIESSFDDTDPEEILSQLSSVELKLNEAETVSLSRERIRQNAALGIRKFIKRWRLRHPDLPNPILPDVKIRKHHGLNAE